MTAQASTPVPEFGKEAVVRLEKLRKQAEDLLRLYRSGDPGAVARVAAGHPGPPGPLKLSAAQLVIACEYGFPSWPALRAYVDRLAEHGPALQHAYHEDLDYYEVRAFGLLASAEDGTEGAVAAFARHRTTPSPAGARIVVAREHGFSGWPALRRHVIGLRDGASRSRVPTGRSRLTISKAFKGCLIASRSS
jgi:hypothetical protein